MEKIEINIDKELDLLTAYIGQSSENKNTHLEVLEGPFNGNVLFHVNPKNNELVMIQIIDFTIIKRILFKHMILLLTKDAIITWLSTLIDSFKANKPKQNLPGYAT